jgi:hypothetical protein
LIAATHVDRNADGTCTLTINAADGRSGSATITITVDDGATSTSTSFNVTVGGGSGASGPPTSPSTSASGSGAVLTWAAPSGATPVRYAIAGGTRPGGNDLPTILTPDASTFYTFPLMPSGTYYFRVYAVTAGGLGAASPESAVTISNGAAPGFATGVMASVSGGEVTVTWDPPSTGSAPSYYWVEFGTGPGTRDAAIVTSVARTYTRGMPAGTFWARVRTVVDGVVGPPSNDVAFVMSPPRCSTPPGAPTLLPVSTSNGRVTFDWVAGGGGAADRYQIVISNGTTLTTDGAATSDVWTSPRGGTLTAQVVGINACGTGPASGAVAFGVQ